MNVESSGALLRSGAEIGPVLRRLQDSRAGLVSYLPGGDAQFESRIRHVDAGSQFIIIDAGSDAEALHALLAMSRCIFHTSMDDWHVEFVADSPENGVLGGKPAIRLRFPEVLSRWQRAHARCAVAPSIPLQCMADSEGIIPFEGLIVDIGPEGLGFLVHAASINLAPGTVLRGCLIEVPGKPVCKVDLEVCYSQSMTLGDGTRSLRSGCRFLDAEGAKEVIRFYLRAGA